MTGAEQTTVAVSTDARFRVLARKYRPSGFDALIGQTALVRTLSNAFRTGRIAHAYMLAGVRGVGKTTTARIIARALNCVGPDGGGGVTISPCGVCEHCTAIAEDRHLDVIEMDAASHTGVDNIRELLDGVPYRPTMARYKVYIVDEVHMLSEKAFNALLKTLEEPPEHVKFIFATTEIRKVPITVLSRCQRFDLRRVEAAELLAHLGRVAERESVAAEPGALQLLARAADGSVRDALSLLDQAIAHGGGAAVSEDTVRDMLGLADRAQGFDMLEAVMRGDAVTALALLDDQYRAGADPTTILEELLGLTHWLTRIKLAPDTAAGADTPEVERVRGRAMAERLSMADVTRAWQMLLKGLGETRVAPVPLHAAEMLLIRLAYAAQLPSPAEALEALAARRSTAPSANPAPSAPAPAPGPRSGSTTETPRGFGPSARTSAASAPSAIAPAPARPNAEPAPPKAEAAADVRKEPHSTAAPASFTDVVELARARNEGLLYGHLIASVHLVRFEPGDIELRLATDAPSDLPQRLSRFLTETTGARWLVTLSRQAGEASLLEQRGAREAARLAEAAAHPLVRAILETFPGAAVERIREQPTAPLAAEATDEAGDAVPAGSSDAPPDPVED